MLCNCYGLWISQALVSTPTFNLLSKTIYGMRAPWHENTLLHMHFIAESKLPFHQEESLPMRFSAKDDNKSSKQKSRDEKTISDWQDRCKASKLNAAEAPLI